MKNLGFTLMEIMVVIAILALLATVLITEIKGSGDKAEQKSFRVHLGEIVKAIELYNTDNGSYPQVEINSYNDITNTFSNYIEKQNIPNFVTTGSITYDPTNTYYCGDTPNQDQYVIYFRASINTTLDFKNLRRSSNDKIVNRFYCVSQTQR